MSFGQVDKKSGEAGEPLWRQYRDQFPVAERLIYLNHAAVAPLPKRCAEAMKSFADDALEYGSLHYDKWMDTYEALRVAAARLIGADRSEIAIVKNTSEGISTVAIGIDWQPGAITMSLMVLPSPLPDASSGSSLVALLMTQLLAVRVSQLSLTPATKSAIRNVR